MNLDGKVVIVTGASSGIGKATAKLFADNGAKIALVARSKDKLESLAKTLPNALVVPTDMTQADQIKAMVQKVHDHFGKIDILINNAGQGYDASVENTNIDTFHKLFDLDVIGPLITMQHVIPIMRKQKGGTIVNISSGTALMYLPNMSAYSSLKRALVGISLTARAELQKDNIVVSVVYPYITDTDFEKNTIKDVPNQPVAQEENSHYTPPPADSPEFVAKKIVEGIQKNEAEIIVHDWMKKTK